MTLGIISGFAVLALASGFYLLKNKGSATGSAGSLSGDAITSDKIDDYVTDATNGFYYVPVGILTNDSITSAPFSITNPDYTGATYIGDDWFLMANNMYFNRKTKVWTETAPELASTGGSGSDDDGKNTGSIVAGGVGAGVGSVVGNVIGTTTDVVADTVKTKNKLAILAAGVVASIAIWYFNKKK